MTEQIRHVSVHIERDAADVYEFCVDPANLPRWAAGLSGSIEQVEGRWFAESPMGRIQVRFAPRNQLGVLDHRVTMADGQVFDNPMRVIAEDDDGSDIVFTLRRRHDMNDKEFEADAAAVREDLETLKGILEGTDTGDGDEALGGDAGEPAPAD
jgi:hypothetical protein